jgi:glycosyltransferase involved in cell wall biosynthesis
MRIGYDVSQTGKSKAGCGYLAYSLCQNLAELDKTNEYWLYPTFGDMYLDPDWPASTLQIIQSNFQRAAGQRNLEEAQLFWRNPSPDFELRLGSPDIVHANNFYCPTGLQKARLVYTLYDMSFLSHPEWTTEANRMGCFDGVFKSSFLADFIVAISRYTQQDFLSVFPHYPAERTAVMPLASRFSGQSIPPRPKELNYLTPGQFWLNVATMEPRKNQRRLAEAYARLKEEVGASFPLVFAGGKGWMLDDFEAFLIQLGIREDVHLLGYVDDNAVIWLLKNCFALVYPSLFEGFGLPALEAMSLGAAVITSNTTSIPEVTGDAALLVDPLDVESIYQAMRRLQMGEVDRGVLQNRAYERSQLFSWQTAAHQILEIYTQVQQLPKLNLFKG